MQKWFIQKKFSERFEAKKTRLLEYASQYGQLVPESMRKEVDNIVQRTKERFDISMSSLNEIERSTQSFNERLKIHTAFLRDVEKWLRKAEEIIVTEPKWKIQVCFYFFWSWFTK